MVDVVTLRELERDGPLELLGSGGEADVLSVGGRPAVAYKRYTATRRPSDRDALERLIALPAAMSDADRQLLLRRAAWPTALVVDAGRLCGVLMPRLSSA